MKQASELLKYSVSQPRTRVETLSESARLMKISLNGFFMSHAEIYLVLAFREMCLVRKRERSFMTKSEDEEKYCTTPVIGGEEEKFVTTQTEREN